jgi:hypothetical protein
MSRMHHQGQLGITGNADQPHGLIFTDPHGRQLKPAAVGPTTHPTITGTDRPPPTPAR